jgi:hypothetical protein
MTVKKKIVPSIDSFIGGGADVKSAKDKAFKNILLRVPADILNELDERLEKKPWLNRTQWIVEAIHEKLGDCSYE